MKLLNLKSRGSILISLLVTLPFLILISASYLSLSTQSYKLGRKDQFHTHAQLAADAGADYAIEKLNQSLDPDTSSPIEIHNDGNIRVTFMSSAAVVDSTHKTITSTGYTYSPVTRTTPNSTVKIKVDLRSITTGNYSLVTGVGGLYLSNSAKIIGGNVFVNGGISMANSSQIGLSTNYVDVSVANQICPKPATSSYPQLCGNGENNNPITISNTAHIYGDVKANYQTNGSGMTNGGLVASSGVTPKTLPAYDRNGHKAAVATTITGSAASCSSHNGTRTWAANTKITGDVLISNNCVVTVLGNVWITGKFEVRNSAIVKVSDSLGGSQPTIMVDGQAGASFTNSSQLASNSSSTGFQILTYYSRASCSPDCTDVTGTDLYNSRNDPTITLDNSAQGPNTIFYARWSQVLINNSGQIGALVGQTVSLKNSGTVTFGTSVSGTGETFWIVDGYRRSY